MAARAAGHPGVAVARIGLQQRARDLVERLRERELGGAGLEHRRVDGAGAS